MLDWHLPRWLRGPGYGRTLGEAVVSEGLACHCEEEVTGKKQPYMTALSDNDLHTYTALVKNQWKKEPYDHTEWFYNNTGKGIPHWAGYSVGYAMVGDYLKTHPTMKASQLYETPADDFLV